MAYIRTLSSQYAEVACDNCGATHTVSRDEDGGGAPETWRCQGDDTCLTRMCGACLTKCDWCDLPACSEHLVDYSGDHVCKLCMQGEKADAQTVEAA